MSAYNDKRVLDSLEDLKKYVVLNEIQAKDIITAEEAATILGKSLSTLYKYTAKGIIGRNYLYFLPREGFGRQLVWAGIEIVLIL